MKKALFSLTVGAGLMYLFDPEHGSQRRKQLLDKIQGTMPKTAEAVNHKVNALGTKASDLTADLTARADDIAAEAVTTLPPQLEGEQSDAPGALPAP